MIPLLSALALAAPICPAPAPPPPGGQQCPSNAASVLVGQVNKMEGALQVADEGLFGESLAQASFALSCLLAGPELIEESAVLAVHRMRAMEGLNNRAAPECLIQEYQSLLRRSRDYDLPADVVGAEHPLRQALGQARSRPPGAEQEVSVPEGLRLMVDGRLEQAYPLERPVILQVCEERGPCIFADELRDPLPQPQSDWVQLMGRRWDEAPAPERSGLGPLGWTAVGLAGASALSLGGGWLTARQAQGSLPTGYVTAQELRAWEQQVASTAALNHGLVISGALLGAGAMGLGLVVVVGD